jgi:hypothetical protein
MRLLRRAGAAHPVRPHVTQSKPALLRRKVTWSAPHTDPAHDGGANRPEGPGVDDRACCQRSLAKVLAALDADAHRGTRVGASRSALTPSVAVCGNARPRRKVRRGGGRKRHRLGEFLFRLEEAAPAAIRFRAVLAGCGIGARGRFPVLTSVEVESGAAPVSSSLLVAASS